ncbi:MAG: preprotein translocase subunit SecG [Planctomycetota bacterium]
MILATFWTSVLSIALIAVSVLLIGLVLLQKNRGSGLSGAFGGVGGHSAFGTKTGDMLTWVTVGLASLFLLLNVAANFVFEPEATPGTQAVAPTPAPGGVPASDAPASDAPTDAEKAAAEIPATPAPKPIPATPKPATQKPAAPTESETDPQQ